MNTFEIKEKITVKIDSIETTVYNCFLLIDEENKRAYLKKKVQSKVNYPDRTEDLILDTKVEIDYKTAIKIKEKNEKK